MRTLPEFIRQSPSTPLMPMTLQSRQIVWKRPPMPPPSNALTKLLLQHVPQSIISRPTRPASAQARCSKESIERMARPPEKTRRVSSAPVHRPAPIRKVCSESTLQRLAQTHRRPLSATVYRQPPQAKPQRPQSASATASYTPAPAAPPAEREVDTDALLEAVPPLPEPRPEPGPRRLTIVKMEERPITVTSLRPRSAPPARVLQLLLNGEDVRPPPPPPVGVAATPKSVSLQGSRPTSASQRSAAAFEQRAAAVCEDVPLGKLGYENGPLAWQSSLRGVGSARPPSWAPPATPPATAAIWTGSGTAAAAAAARIQPTSARSRPGSARIARTTAWAEELTDADEVAELWLSFTQRLLKLSRANLRDSTWMTWMDSRPKLEQLHEFRERSAEEPKRIDAAAGMVASMGLEELTKKLAEASIVTTGSRPELEERMLAHLLGEDVNYVSGAGSRGGDRAGALAAAAEDEGPGEILSPRSLAVMRSLTRSSPPVHEDAEMLAASAPAPATAPAQAIFKLRVIKDMRVVDGKREWLVAWDGEDEHGEGLPDSWEPTANVSEVARTEYFETANALAHAPAPQSRAEPDILAASEAAFSRARMQPHAAAPEHDEYGEDGNQEANLDSFLQATQEQ